MGVMEMGWWQVGRRRQFRRGGVGHPPMLYFVVMLYDVTFQKNDFFVKTKKIN